VASPQRAEESPPPSAYTQVDALVKEKRFEEALRLAKRLLAEAERTLGPESLAAADGIDALHLAQWRSGTAGWNSDEAKRRVEHAVRIKERLLGPRHLDVALSITALIPIYASREEWADADRDAQRVVSIREEHLGQDSMVLGRAIANLALVEWRLGDFAASRRDYVAIPRITCLSIMAARGSCRSTKFPVAPLRARARRCRHPPARWARAQS